MASLTIASSRPANAGTDDARAVDEKGIEGDRIRQVSAVLDQMHVQRLANRDVERADDAKPKRQCNQVPHLDPTERGQQRQDDRLREHQRLREIERAAAPYAIGEHTGPCPEEQNPDIRAKRDDAEQPRRAGKR
jgi:hypothetical protein